MGNTKYVLISFYKRHQWDVYGHIGPHRNEFLGEYPTMKEATDKAFSYMLPVMLGQGAHMDRDWETY